MLLKAFGELAAGGGKSFPGARKRQFRQCSHTSQSIYRSVWTNHSVFDPTLSQKDRWCEDGPGRDIQERKAAQSIVPCLFWQWGAQAWRNWVSLVLLREWLLFFFILWNWRGPALLTCHLNPFTGLDFLCQYPKEIFCLWNLQLLTLL